MRSLLLPFARELSILAAAVSLSRSAPHASQHKAMERFCRVQREQAHAWFIAVAPIILNNDDDDDGEGCSSPSIITSSSLAPPRLPLLPRAGDNDDEDDDEDDDEEDDCN